MALKSILPNSPIPKIGHFSHELTQMNTNENKHRLAVRTLMQRCMVTSRFPRASLRYQTVPFPKLDACATRRAPMPSPRSLPSCQQNNERSQFLIEYFGHSFACANFNAALHRHLTILPRTGEALGYLLPEA